MGASVRHGRRRVGHYVDRLIADARGVSLIEFALVAPLLIMLLLSMMDAVPLSQAKTKLNQATESTGDIAAAASQMQSADMVNVFAAAAQVMTPLSTNGLVVRVSNVYSDGAGHAKIYWSCGQGILPALVPNSQLVTTSNGDATSSLLWLYGTGASYNGNTSGTIYNGTNTSFVMVESRYTYTPAYGFIVRSPVALSNAVYLMPRQSSYVGFPWNGNTNNQPPAPTSTTTLQTMALGSTGVTCRYAT